MIKKNIIRATNTLKELVLIYVIIVTVSALIFSVVEGKYFWDSLWWAMVTATTTGYGDMYPVTLVGRIFASALMLFSILVTAMLVGRIIVDFSPDPPNLFTEEEQQEILTRLRRLDPNPSPTDD